MLFNDTIIVILIKFLGTYIKLIELTSELNSFVGLNLKQRGGKSSRSVCKLCHVE